MLVIAALVALAQAPDAGVEWTLPPEIPFAPDPIDPAPIVEPDAGVPPLVVEDRVSASARISAVMSEMPLSTGTAAPFSVADVAVSRQVGAWLVGVNALFAAASSDFRLRDRGTTFFAGWRSPVDSAYGITFAVHPLGLQRLRVGMAPISYGSDLGPIVPDTFGGISLFSLSDPRMALSIAASLGRFEVHGWTQTMQVVEVGPASTREPKRVAQFSVGASASLGAFQGGLDLVHAPRGSLPSFTASSGTPVTFRSGRLHLGVSSEEGVPAPVDFAWETQNPLMHLAFFPAEEPLSGVNWVARAEASRVAQQFATTSGSGGNPSGVPTSPPTATERELWLGGLLASLQTGRFRLHLRAVYRPAEYFVVEGPVTVFTDISAATPELAGRLTAEWLFGRALPRVGLGFGLIGPATGRTAGGVVRFRHPGVVSPTQNPSPLLEARGTVSWQPHPLAALAAELKVENNPERQSFEPAQATQLFASVLLQIRL